MTQTLEQTPVAYVRPRLYPKQLAAIFSPSRYAIIEASTKSGKTVGCIVWLHEQAALNGGPNRHFWWIAPIKRVARIAFRRLKAYLPPDTFKSNETEMTITLRNGAVIVFLGAEDPDTLYGEDVFAAVIDEATRIKPGAWHAVRSTLTATQGPIRIIGNVKGSRNWAYKLARKAETGLREAYHYAKLTVNDAVAAGIFPREEQEDAKDVLPDAVYRELYMAEAADAGDQYIQVDKIGIVQGWPDTAKTARVWDFAITDENADVDFDPDYTAGVKLAFDGRRTFVLDVIRERKTPDVITELVKATAARDGRACTQLIEEEKGAAGAMMVALFKRMLRSVQGAGRVQAAKVTGNKAVRAFHFAADCNDGNVLLVEGPWNDKFLEECEDFPGGPHDDQIDAAAHGYNFLRPNIGRREPRWL